MRSVLSIVTARWFTTLIGALILSSLVWFVGPLIAIGDVRPLDGEVTRLLVVFLILAVWAGLNAWAILRSKRADKALIEGAVAGGDAGGAGEEIAALRQRLEESIEVLRAADTKGGRGGRFLYQLPWYIMIGPPGSGKTTALENSGLVRHTPGAKGGRGVRGVGGTRDCEWLFTERAVLIDTAGRYTTQDSDEARDSAGWRGFLDLLKKTRPRRPINGAIIAVSLSDLVSGGEEERRAHAQAVRRRLNELYTVFGVRFPTYLVLTKADLVSGFNEYFEDLGKTQREQVWGITFPDTEGAGDAPEGVFATEFDLLVERLNQRLLDRLQRETDADRRGLIFGFPAQVASLRDPVAEFLTDAFQATRYERKPLLRGVYFTSGTQEGTPFDRLTAGIARAAGVDRAAIVGPKGPGRAYYITDLLREVVFPEADLVGVDPVLERRARWIQRGVWAVSALALVAALSAWTVSYLSNEALIAEANALAERYERDLAAVPKDSSNLDLDNVLPPLETLRSLSVRVGSPEPLKANFGLYQGDKVYETARDAYIRTLNTLLAPPLVFRLEAQLRENRKNVDFLYEALKVYLMLTGRGPMNPDLVRTWMAYDWEAMFPGPLGEPKRAILAAHLDALLSAPLTPVSPDAGLIDQSRLELARFPLAERAYAHLRGSAAARALPEWRLVEAGGPATARVFTRPSGKLLSEGIPGLFTRDGFYKVLLPGLKDVTEETREESWVLGDQAPKDGVAGEKLTRDVLQLYLDDYVSRWDQMLNDLALPPMRSATEAAQIAAELSGPASPLRNVLKAAAAETTLAASKSSYIDGASQAVKAAAESNLPNAGRLAQVLANTNAAIKAVPEPGKPVDDHYRPLRDFVEGKTGVPGASLDDLMRSLNDLYMQMSRAGTGGASLSAAAPSVGPSPAQQIAAAAARMPGSVAALAKQLSQAGTAASVGGKRDELNGLWTSQVLPFCRQATENRYPIYRSASADVPLDDFAKLFGPGGMIDGFFNQNLKPYIDMTKQPWRWQKVDGADLGASAASLAQFQRAAAIRDAFFGAGGGARIGFDLISTAMDPAAQQILVDIEGQQAIFTRNAARPQSMKWPGTVPQSRVTVNGGMNPDLVVDGPWSLFRLVDRAKAGTQQKDRLSLTLSAGGLTFGFDLRAASVVNPFTLRDLGEFRCPGSL